MADQAAPQSAERDEDREVRLAEEGLRKELTVLRKLAGHMEEARDSLNEDNPWHEACAGFARNLAQTIARHEDPESVPASTITIGRKDRNRLSRLMAWEMAGAGEGLADLYGPRVSLMAQMVSALIPVRRALGWEGKIGRKEGKNREWKVPAKELANAVALQMHESRKRYLAAVGHIEEHQRDGDAVAESIARETLGRAAADLDCLIALEGELQALGIDVVDFRRGCFGGEINGDA